MRSIVRWEPFDELISLRDAMDRLFEESVIRPRGTSREGGQLGLNLPIDMYEEEGKLVVKAAVPGVKPEDMDISVTGDTLTIRGETKASESVKENDYIYREHRYGSFSRSIPLPPEANAEEAEATFEDGMLMLTIPKKPVEAPKRIEVKTGK